MTTDETINQRKLRQAIVEAFNESELKTLCFDLHLDYETLPPGHKIDKARGLVARCLREKRVDDLLSLCEEIRPKIAWRAFLETAVSSQTPPFMGLKYFDVANADLFFGREALTAELTAHLQNDHFLAVVGASGSGKSSLVRAGLVAAMQQDDPNLLIHVFTPTDHPLESVAATLTRNSSSIGVTAKFIDGMAQDRRSLHLAARRLVQENQKLLLVIDQFEELFTLCRSEAKRQAFIDNLVTAVADTTNGPTHAVIALRADFYHHCAQYDDLRRLLEKQQRFIGAMSPTELRRAIEEPASRSGLTFESGLVDLLLRDVGAGGDQPPEPGALPLLSHALLETWRRREGNQLTFSGYTEAGGVQGAIAKTAESVFQEQLTPAQQTIARSIFLRLTELGEGTQDTRRRALISELLPASDAVEETQTVLNLLSAARLVTTDEESAEVAHEALIREWPTLRFWLSRNREGLRLHRHLTESAQAWRELEQDPGELYRGSRLEQAIEWAAQHDDELNDLERGFLAASIAQQKQQTRQARLIRAASIAVLLFIVAGLTVATLIFNRQAQENQDLADGQATQAAIADLARATSDSNAATAVAAEATARAANAEINSLIEQQATLGAQLNNLSGDGEEAQAFFATATALAAAAQDVDGDADGLTLAEETAAGTDPTNPDTDLDGLNDGGEIAAGANPLKFDTDDDGRFDGDDEDPIRPLITATNLAELGLEEIITLRDDTAAAFLPQGLAIGPATSGPRFVAASRTGDEFSGPSTVYLWRLSDGLQMLPPQSTGSISGVLALGFTADNIEMYAVSRIGVTAWALDLGEQIWQQNNLSGFGLNNACSAAFHPDGSTVLVGGFAKWGYFSIGAEGLEEIESDSQNYNTNACYTNAIFSYDGTHFGLIEDENQDESVFVGVEVNRSFGRPFNKSVSGVIDMALSPDNNTLALGFENGRVELYDYAASNNSPPLIYPLEAHVGFANAVFSPDGSILATSSPQEGIVRLWHAADGAPLPELTDHAAAAGITSLIFSPDGHYLLFGTTEGEVHVYGMPEIRP